MSAREELERRLAELRDVSRRPSRHGDSESYFVGDREIAHFHGNERLDVRLTKEVIRQHKAQHDFDERVRTRGPSAEWVAVRILDERDLPLAVSMVAEAARANE
jgi:luciferase-like monooxygenase